MTREERKREEFAADVHRMISRARRTMRSPSGQIIEGAPLRWIPIMYLHVFDELVALGRFKIITRVSRLGGQVSYISEVEK